MAKYWLVQLDQQRLIKCEEFTEDRDQEVHSSKGASNEQRWLKIPDGVAAGNAKLNIDDADPDNIQYSLVDGSADKEGPLWDALRNRRDKMLSESDWTQLADNQLAAQDQTDWTNYRQYLRDIPQNESDPEMEPQDFATWLAAQE